MFKKQTHFKKVFYFFIFFVLSTSFLNTAAFSKDHNQTSLKVVYNLLSAKNFDKALNVLEELSKQNNVKAQHLYSQILYAGNIIPQDFEMSYYWSNISSLGGYKKSTKIVKLLEDFLAEEQKIKIKNNLRNFLEKHAMKKNKLAIIQIAKWHLNLSEEKDYTNAYKWFNVAVAVGIKSAIKKRNEIIGELSSEQILEAQKLSNEIFNKINQSGG